MKPPKPLANISVMLSASIPDELQNSPQAQDLFSVIMLFTRHILRAGGRLLFGGHPTVTPLVHQVASAMEHDDEAVQLYQLRLFRDTLPQEVSDQRVFRTIHWSGREKPTPPPASETFKKMVGEDLQPMREEMVQDAQAAVFVGGKIDGYLGDKPGIRDEYDRFMEKHPQGPVYLIGLLQGESQKIIDELEHNGKREPNGLTDRQLRILHHGQNIDLIVPVVVADIAKTCRP